MGLLNKIMDCITRPYDSIYRKLLILTLSIIGAAITSIVFFSHSILISTISKEIGDRYTDRVLDVMDAIDRMMYSKYSKVQDISGSPEIQKDITVLLGEILIDSKIAFITIIDKDRNVIYSSDPYYKNRIHETKIHEFIAVREALKGFTGSVVEYDRGGGDKKKLLIFYTHEHGFKDFKGNNWSLILGLDYDRIMAPVTDMKKKIVIGALISFAIVAVVLYYSIRSIVRPILELKRGTKIVSEGHLDYEIHTGSGDEIGQLAESFNSMVKSLKAKTDELERSNKELAQFAYIASHDLQEPLRTVAGFTQLIEKRYKDKLDKDGREFIDYIIDGTVRMHLMINDLLVYSRLNTGDKSFKMVDCNDVMEKALQNLKAQIAQRKAAVTSDKLPTVYGERTQLLHLFQNLISNGIKYNDKEIPEIHVSAKKLNGQWFFSFSDNGIGIESKYHEKIFNIFYRLHGKGEYSGTGIGLAICRKIVEAHGGRIWVESWIGKGSVFYFTIPDKA